MVSPKLNDPDHLPKVAAGWTLCAVELYVIWGSVYAGLAKHGLPLGSAATWAVVAAAVAAGAYCVRCWDRLRKGASAGAQLGRMLAAFLAYFAIALVARRFIVGNGR